MWTRCTHSWTLIKTTILSRWNPLQVGYPEETCFLMEEEDESEDGIGDYQRCESRCADRRCPAGGGRSRPVAARCGGGLLCCCGECRELEEGGAGKVIRWRGGPVGARDEDEREKRKRRKRRKKKNNRRKKKKGGRKKKGKRRKGGKNRHRKKRKNKSKGHRLAAGGVDKGKQEKKHGEDDKGQDLTEHGLSCLFFLTYVILLLHPTAKFISPFPRPVAATSGSGS